MIGTTKKPFEEILQALEGYEKIAVVGRDGCAKVCATGGLASDLALGESANPNFEPLDLQLIKMENKVNAGCQFFQTQPVYEPKKIEVFMKKAEKFGAPVMFGMVIIKSPGMAKFINDNVTGIQVPEAWIKELDSVPQGAVQKKATEMTIKLLKGACPHVPGDSFYAVWLVRYNSPSSGGN
jgi:5,10-methylenetetrahydrofolate reductase